jgi:hypothetical protein
MPTSWEYRGDVLLVVTEGLDTPDEWQQALQDAMRDPRFRRGTPLLFDGRRGYSPLGSEDLERGLQVIAGAIANGASPTVGLLMRDTPRELLEMLTSRRDEIAAKTGVCFRAFGDEAEAIASLQSGS